MAAEMKVKIERKTLAALEREIEDFQERYAVGEIVAQDEWDVFCWDWLNLVNGGLYHLIAEQNILMPEDRKRLMKVIQRLRDMKSKILEKGYEYPTIIDRITIEN